MEKIICDICGTVCPENATVCPICGFPCQNGDKVADEPGAESTVETSAAPRKSTRGGYFSNKNARKRNKDAGAAVAAAQLLNEGAEPPEQEPEEEPEEERNSNRGMLIVIALLSVAIVLVGAFVGFRYFSGGFNPGLSEGTESTEPSVPETTVRIPCESLNVDNAALRFTQQGSQWRLIALTQPLDTTDAVIFMSSNENVATVTQDGVVTAVGPGDTIITITCGEISRICAISCEFSAETTVPDDTKPTEPTQGATQPSESTEPTEPTKPAEPEVKELKLSHIDVTLTRNGEQFTIRATQDGRSIKASKVQWKSSDPKVVTVKDGVVTAVSSGTATITATYNGKSASCVVRCKLPAQTQPTEPEEPTKPTEPKPTEPKPTEPQPTEPKPTEPEEPTKPTDPEETLRPTEPAGPTISASDVTIMVGESFSLRLKDASGKTMSVAWTASQDGIVSISGNTITGVAAGTVTVSTTVDGVTYSCIVRVK